jgi:hypothetical protein
MQEVVDMITLQIGTAERRDGDIEKRWIQDQVNSRRKNGEPICVTLHIQCDGINIKLASGDCAKSGGGSRQLKKKEQFIVDEWKKGFSQQRSKTGDGSFLFGVFEACLWIISFKISIYKHSVILLQYSSWVRKRGTTHYSATKIFIKGAIVHRY